VAFIELVCTQCQESRYRSKIEITPEMKLAPEMFIPVGEQPDSSTYKESPLCYHCNGTLRPMPVGPSAKLSREDGAALREQEEMQKRYRKPIETDIEMMPVGQDSSIIRPIFECAKDEDNMEMSTLPDGRVLVKTSRRLFILDLKEALGV
jgi:hypothetical protein